MNKTIVLFYVVLWFYYLAEIKEPFQIMIRSFLLTSSLACAYPKMLGPLVLGRLLPFAPGSNILNNFINGVYEKGLPRESRLCICHGIVFV